uniref:PLD phosphodiesterase domain-containing protein n=1 Tax=Meloidogyne incognita TaxID=6306 RepID=A0A914MLZ9_MELIC
MKRKHLLGTCSDECFSSTVCDFDREFSHPNEEVANNNDDLICIASIDASESSLTKKLKLTNNNKTTNNLWPPPFLGNGLYLTKIDCLPPETNQRALSLFELIRQIRPIASIHFSFCIDPGWVIKQYSRSLRNNPISFIVGQPEFGELEKECKNWSNIQVAGAVLPFPFGTHHTKLSLFESEHSLHVVVGTANLMPQDWAFKTQMFYHFAAPFAQESGPLIEIDVEDIKTKVTGQSFRDDLVEYLRAAYPQRCGKAYKLVSYWIERIIGGQADFSKCRDRLIASVPGRFQKSNGTYSKFGHLKLRASLSSKFIPIELQTLKTFIGQFSSIGSLGAKAETWLSDEFLCSLSGSNSLLPPSSLKLIYPTVENVRQSLEGYAAGFYLPYLFKNHIRQNYLLHFFHQWKSDKHGRSLAMPHVKSYAGLDENSKVNWILMSSANLSTSAWGKLEKCGEQLFIRSYELGVLLCEKDHPEGLLLPYDLPLQKYESNDQPFVQDIIYPKLPPDSFGFQGSCEVREASK